MILDEYKGEYYILNELQNKNNPKEDRKTNNIDKPLVIQKMEDKKEEREINNNNKKIFCCYSKKKKSIIYKTEIEMAIIHKKISIRKKQVDNFFKNNTPLFTGIKYNDKYITSTKELNPFDNIFKNNKELFISTNPFDNDL